MQSNPDYQIYPSLLICFQRLLDYELEAEEPWNKTPEEGYRLSPGEIYLSLECELLNMINRAPQLPNEAADKGTAFNEIVDCLIERRGSSKEDCHIHSVKDENGETAIEASINGFTFTYDLGLCKGTAAYFEGSLTQYHAQGDMSTPHGTARLYGFADEWQGNKMSDIKTTSKYTFGRYERGWQRYVYPWCAIESGDATEIACFEYYIVEWKKSKNREPLKAKGIYRETYNYNHDEAARKLQWILSLFLPWLEEKRAMGLIQDKRIFGGENPEGWHGIYLSKEELKDIYDNREKKGESICGD